jgi:hypothetical protein
MRLTLAALATLLLSAPAFADPGWYANEGSIGNDASNDENINLSVYCGVPDAPPLQVDFADFNDDVGGIPRYDITFGTLVVAAGKAKAQRFHAIYQPDNTDFLLTGADAAAVINMALLGKGLTIYVEVRGRPYSRGRFDNIGMDQAEAPLKACLAQSEAAK